MDGSNRNIFVMNPDGTGQDNLTNGVDGQEYAQPAWSPDHSLIAYSSNQDGNFEIYVMNADGSGPRRVTPGDGETNVTPAWSPDGGRLVYVSTQARGGNVMMINLDGTDMKRLTAEPGDYAKPAWSPDGRTIAFVMYGAFGAEIHHMDNNGSNQRPYLTDPEEEFDLPTWSPDGTQMAFVSKLYSDAGLTAEIYIRDMSTEKDRLLISVQEQFITTLSWSEDATELVYTVSDLTLRKRQIRAVDTQGQNLRQLTNDTAVAYDVAWSSPKGTGQVNYGVTAVVNEVYCEGTLPSRFAIGMRGRVTPGGVNNRLRNGPGTDYSILGSVDPGDRFEVIGGPECGDGYTWWEILKDERDGGGEGWTVEAAPNEYWLQPIIRQNFILEPPVNKVLLSGGRGLTTGATMNQGNFQVEGYCENQGYQAALDTAQWYCRNGNGSTAFMLLQVDYDSICQQTYNNSTAVGVRNGEGRRTAYRWRCYGDNGGGATASATAAPTGGGGVDGTDGNLDALAEGEQCAGRLPQHEVDDSIIVDFNRGGALRILVDYRSSSLRTTSIAYDNETLRLQDGPVCWGGLIYWYIAQTNATTTFYGWAAEADDEGNPFMCPESNNECRR